MKSGLLITNPNSGGGRRWSGRLPEMLSILRGGGFSVEVRETERAGHATLLAREAVEAGHQQVIFGLGGDGTQRELAAGLLGSKVELAMLPAGTVNVIALAFGLPGDPIKACRAYCGPLSTHLLDVGMCGDTPFLIMVSAGIDAEILHRTAASAKQRWGRLAVATQTAATIPSYRFPLYTLSHEGEKRRGTFIVVSNMHLYGGPVALSPRADPCDEMLDALVFDGRRLATLSFAIDALMGTHLRREDVATWETVEATLEGEQRYSLLQIDGDPLRVTLPVKIALAPEKVVFLAPAGPSEGGLSPLA